MSHFCVYVFHDKDTSIDTLLAPYGENLVLEPYLEYTKEEAIAHVRKEIEDYKNGTYAEYLKNPEEYEKKYGRNNGHIEYLKVEFPKKLNWTDEQCYEYMKSLYDPDMIDKDGNILSRYNPKTKWDWYVVGGRWSGGIPMKTNTKLRMMAESAIMLALATVLSIFKLYELPYGGSITIASMLPLLIIAYRYGTGWGLITGVVYGIIQQLLGLKNLSYFTTWQSIVAIIMLDYLVAFMVIGLGGLFRKMKSQPMGLVLGGLVICLLRYLCHVTSGATVWAGLSIPTEAALIYSFGYNATYMLPETIILLVVAYYIGSKLDFRNSDIVPYKAEAKAKLPLLQWIGGLLVAGALVYDTVAVFSKLQNADSGEFDVTGFSAVDWKLMAIITGCALVVAAVLFVIGKKTAPVKDEKIEKLN